MHIAPLDGEVRGDAHAVVEVVWQRPRGWLDDIGVSQEEQSDGPVDAALYPCFRDSLGHRVHDPQVAVRPGALRLTGFTLAPRAPVEHPCVEHIGVAPLPLGEVVHQTADKLGRGVLVRRAVVGAEVAPDVGLPHTVDQGVPVGVRLGVAQHSVAVRVPHRLARGRVRVISRVVWVGIGRVDVERLQHMAARLHADAQLAHERMPRLLNAPVVHAVARHPEQELLVPAILPSMEAAEGEVRGLLGGDDGKTPLWQEWYLLSKRARGEPPRSQSMKQVVRSVERANAIGSLDEHGAVTIGLLRVDPVALRRSVAADTEEDPVALRGGLRWREHLEVTAVACHHPEHALQLHGRKAEGAGIIVSLVGIEPVNELLCRGRLLC